MDSTSLSSGGGNSPDISALLHLHGHRLNVASIGPTTLAVRTDTAVAPGTGLVRLTVGEKVTIYHVNLFEGIDPARLDQPFKLIDIADEAAA
jgi:hypothetical protein